jgi:nitronate monooxygenase
MILDRLAAPVVLAPLAGGPSTPQLTAAVSAGGGLGFLALGYLSAEQAAEQIASVRSRCDRPFGVNLFVPGGAAADPAELDASRRRLRDWSADELGDPRRSDDDWDAKLALVCGDPVAAVSFTFGCPPASVIGRLRAAGSEAWVSVTSVAEAEVAVAAGADALVVQGAEAGGHRASFTDRPDLPVDGLLALLQLVGARVDAPLVAAGGIATGRAIAATLCAGAAAAQIGTAFMLCPEAGTSPAHRRALTAPGATRLTRAFTGRLARGIGNEFMDAHDGAAPLAYPEVHYITAPLRRAARERGDAGSINLWAGEAHELAEELPACDLLDRLVADARAAAQATATRLGRSRCDGSPSR